VQAHSTLRAGNVAHIPASFFGVAIYAALIPGGDPVHHPNRLRAAVRLDEIQPLSSSGVPSLHADADILAFDAGDFSAPHHSQDLNPVRKTLLLLFARK